MTACSCPTPPFRGPPPALFPKFLGRRGVQGYTQTHFFLAALEEMYLLPPSLWESSLLLSNQDCLSSLLFSWIPGSLLQIKRATTKILHCPCLLTPPQGQPLSLGRHQVQNQWYHQHCIVAARLLLQLHLIAMH